MKNSYKVALLAALGLITVSSAQAAQPAQGDMVLGLTDSSSSVGGTHNDYVIDIGSINLYTLTSVESGSLSSSAIASVLGSDSATSVNHLSFGVVGAATVPNLVVSQTGFGSGQQDGGALGGTASVYPTVLLGVTPSTTDGAGGNSWSSIISVNPNTGGTDPSGNSIDNDTANPMAWLSGGTGSALLSTVVYDGSDTQTPSGLGTFTVNLNTDTWTYNGLDATSVPEPASYGLFAAAGLLIVSLRNKFGRKQA